MLLSPLFFNLFLLAFKCARSDLFGEEHTPCSLDSHYFNHLTIFDLLPTMLLGIEETEKNKSVSSKEFMVSWEKDR